MASTELFLFLLLLLLSKARLSDGLCADVDGGGLDVVAALDSSSRDGALFAQQIFLLNAIGYLRFASPQRHRLGLVKLAPDGSFVERPLDAEPQTFGALTAAVAGLVPSSAHRQPLLTRTETVLLEAVLQAKERRRANASLALLLLSDAGGLPPSSDSADLVAQELRGLGALVWAVFPDRARGDVPPEHLASVRRFVPDDRVLGSDGLADFHAKFKEFSQVLCSEKEREASLKVGDGGPNVEEIFGDVEGVPSQLGQELNTSTSPSTESPTSKLGGRFKIQPIRTLPDVKKQIEAASLAQTTSTSTERSTARTEPPLPPFSTGPLRSTKLSSEACVDVVILLNTATSSAVLLQRRKALASVLAKWIPDGANVRLSVVGFGSASTTVQSLMRGGRTELLEGIASLSLTSGQAKHSAGIGGAVEELGVGRRPGSSLVLLLSDGEGAEPTYRVLHAARALRNVNAKLVALSAARPSVPALANLRRYASRSQETDSKPLIFTATQMDQLADTLADVFSASECERSATLVAQTRSLTAAPTTTKRPKITRRPRPPTPAPNTPEVMAAFTDSDFELATQDPLRASGESGESLSAALAPGLNSLLPARPLSLSPAVGISGLVCPPCLRSRKTDIVLIADEGVESEEEPGQWFWLPLLEQVVSMTPVSACETRLALVTYSSGARAPVRLVDTSKPQLSVALRETKLSRAPTTSTVAALRAGTELLRSEAAEEGRKRLVILLTGAETSDPWPELLGPSYALHQEADAVIVATARPALRPLHRQELLQYAGGEAANVLDSRDHLPLLLRSLAAFLKLKECSPGGTGELPKPMPEAVLGAAALAAFQSSSQSKDEEEASETSSEYEYSEEYESVEFTTAQPDRSEASSSEVTAESSSDSSPETSAPSGEPNVIALKVKGSQPIKKERAVAKSLWGESEATTAAAVSVCDTPLADILLVIDTQGDEEVLKAHVSLAEDLIRTLPRKADLFKVGMAVIRAGGLARVELSLAEMSDRDKVLRRLKDLKSSGPGDGGLAFGVLLALDELKRAGRAWARPVLLILGRGKSSDPWSVVKSSAEELGRLRATVWAASLAPAFPEAELEAYAANPARLFLLHNRRDLLPDFERFLEQPFCYTPPPTSDEDYPDLPPPPPPKRRFPASHVASRWRLTRRPTLPPFGVTKRRRTRTTTTEAPELQRQPAALKISEMEAEELRTAPLTAAPTSTTSQPDAATTLSLETLGLGGPPKASQCQAKAADILLLVDTSWNFRLKIEAQTTVALEVSSLLPFEGGVLRLCVVGFAEEAFTVLDLAETLSPAVRQARIRQLPYTGGASHAATALLKAAHFLQQVKRPRSLSVLVVLSDGRSEEAAALVSEASAAVAGVADAAFALPVVADAFEPRLQRFVGPRGSVISRVDLALLKGHLWDLVCAPPASPPLSVVAPQPISRLSGQSARRASLDEELPCYPNLDLMLVLDASGKREDFAAQKRAALRVVESLPASRSQRLGLAVIHFGSVARLELELDSGASKEQALQAIRSLRFAPRNEPANLHFAVLLASKEIARAHRTDAFLLVLILARSSSEAETDLVQRRSQQLHAAGPTVLALNLASRASREASNALIAYTRNTENVFRRSQLEDFLVKTQILVVKKVCTRKGDSSQSPDYGDSDIQVYSGSAKEDSFELGNSGPLVDPLDYEDGREAQSSFEAEVRASIEAESRSAKSQSRVPLAELDCSAKGPRDVFVLLDVSSNIAPDQVALQRRVAQQMASLMPLGDVRLALISFAGEAELEVGLNDDAFREGVVSVLEELRFRRGQPAATSEATALLDELAEVFRSRQPLVLLLHSGVSADPWGLVLAASKRLRELAPTSVYAFSVVPQPNVPELVQYTGSAERVFGPNTVDDFFQAVIQELCVAGTDLPQLPVIFPPSAIILPPASQGLSKESDDASGSSVVVELEGESSEQPERRGPCRWDGGADVVVVMDTSRAVRSAWKAAKAVAGQVVESAASLLRTTVDLVAYDKSIRIIRRATKSSVESLKLRGGPPSPVRGLQTALNILTDKDPARRKIIVMVSNGASGDLWRETQALLRQLDGTEVVINGVSLSEAPTLPQLLLFVGCPCRMFDPASQGDLYSALRRQSCAPRAPLNKRIPHSASSTEVSSQEDGVKASGFDALVAEPCQGKKAVDVQILVDASRRSRKVFEAALEAVIEMVWLMPLEQATRVSVIFFSEASEVMVEMEEVQSKEAIINVLAQADYRGGRPMVARALLGAAQRMRLRGRAKAKKLLVLLHDGGSREPWQEVGRASAALRDTYDGVMALSLARKAYHPLLLLYTADSRALFRHQDKDRLYTGLVKMLCSNKAFRNAAALKVQSEQIVGKDNIRRFRKLPKLPEVKPPRIPSVEEETFEYYQTTLETQASTTDHPTTAKTASTSTTTTPSSPATTSIAPPVPPLSIASVEPISCAKYAMLDITLVIDRSANMAGELMGAQREAALALLRTLPLMASEVMVRVVAFGAQASVAVQDSDAHDLTFVEERLGGLREAGGATLVGEALGLAGRLIDRRRKEGATAHLVLLSNGRSDGPWQVLEASLAALRRARVAVFALSVREDLRMPQLLLLAGCSCRVFPADQLDGLVHELRMSACRMGTDPPTTAKPTEATTPTTTTTTTTTAPITTVQLTTNMTKESKNKKTKKVKAKKTRKLSTTLTTSTTSTTTTYSPPTTSPPTKATTTEAKPKAKSIPSECLPSDIVLLVDASAAVASNFESHLEASAELLLELAQVPSARLAMTALRRWPRNKAQLSEELQEEALVEALLELRVTRKADAKLKPAVSNSLSMLRQQGRQGAVKAIVYAGRGRWADAERDLRSTVEKLHGAVPVVLALDTLGEGSVGGLRTLTNSSEAVFTEPFELVSALEAVLCAPPGPASSAFQAFQPDTTRASSRKATTTTKAPTTTTPTTTQTTTISTTTRPITKANAPRTSAYADDDDSYEADDSFFYSEYSASEEAAVKAAKESKTDVLTEEKVGKRNGQDDLYSDDLYETDYPSQDLEEVKEARNSSESKEAHTEPPRDCSPSRKADVIIAVDRTTTGSSALVLAKSAVVEVLSQLPLSSYLLRVGLEAFDAMPQTLLDLTPAPLLNETLMGLQILGLRRSPKEPGLAEMVLRAAKVFRQESGNRTEKILILVSDGRAKADDWRELRGAVRKAREEIGAVYALTPSPPHPHRLQAYTGEKTMRALWSLLLLFSIRRRDAAAKLSGELFIDVGVFQLPETQYLIRCEPNKTTLALLLDNSAQAFAVLEEQKNAALEIASLLPLDSPNLNLFVATTSPKAEILVQPGDGIVGEQVAKAIVGIEAAEAKAGLPELDAAVAQLTEQMDKVRNGGQSVLVLISNGKASEAGEWKSKRAQALDILHNRFDASVHALALDPDADLSSLVQYTNCSCRVYQMDGFPTLVANIGKALCGARPQFDPIGPAGPCELRPGVEVLVVLDATSRVSPDGREVARTAARTLVQDLGRASPWVSLSIAALKDSGPVTDSKGFSTDIRNLLSDVEVRSKPDALSGRLDTWAALDQIQAYGRIYGDLRKRLITVFLTNGDLEGLDRASVVAEVAKTGQRDEVWAFGLDRGSQRNLLQLSKCECRLGEAVETGPMVERLQGALCPPPPKPGRALQPSQPELICDKRIEVDVMLVVDTSAEMRGDFAEVKEAAKAIVGTIPLDFGARVGIVSFGDVPTSHIRLVDFQDQESIAGYIDYLEAYDVPGRAGAAMDYVADILKADSRSPSKTWVIILSNGRTEDKMDVVEAAAGKLEELSSLVFASSLGDDPNLPTLLELTQCICRVFSGGARGPAFLEELRENFDKAQHCDFRPAPDATPLPGAGFGYDGRRRRL